MESFLKEKNAMYLACNALVMAMRSYSLEEVLELLELLGIIN